MQSTTPSIAAADTMLCFAFMTKLAMWVKRTSTRAISENREFYHQVTFPSKTDSHGSDFIG
jgi:hypothetical protein